MRLIGFSVYDVKADAYITPFFLPKQAMALRAFSDAVNSPTHQFNSHPGDYKLYEVGHFDVDTGELVGGQVHIADGLSLYKPTSQLSLDGIPPLERDESSARANGGAA